MKRTQLRRRTPMRSSGRPQRKTRIRQLRLEPIDRGEREDAKYIAWLWTQPCRVPGCKHTSEPHHLRHDAKGAGLGAHIKDDRRAISLCHWHHIERLHRAPQLLRLELGCDDLKAWQDDELAIQRDEWMQQQSRELSAAIAF